MLLLLATSVYFYTCGKKGLRHPSKDWIHEPSVDVRSFAAWSFSISDEKNPAILLLKVLRFRIATALLPLLCSQMLPEPPNGPTTIWEISNRGSCVLQMEKMGKNLTVYFLTMCWQPRVAICGGREFYVTRSSSCPLLLLLQILLLPKRSPTFPI